MSKEYAPLAAQIIDLVGGSENITSAYHCQTRLRFVLADEKQANIAELEATDGVVKALSSGGMFQVVVGTHVKDVFDEVDRELQEQGRPVGHDTDAPPAEKRNPLEVVIDFISGTFMPLIPALSGAGMVKAVLALLVVTKVVTNTSQTYVVLNFMADAVFYFMPVLLAYSAAVKLKSSPILGACVALMMMHPTWGALVAAKAPVSLFEFIPLALTTYQATVIPILLVVLVQSVVEKWLNRVVPKSINLVFVPLLTFLIMGPLAMALLGPIGAFLGGYLAAFFTILSTNAAWAPALIIGALLPVMVMFGVHTAIAPLGILQMSQLGYDSIFGPGALVSNISQAVAALIVAIRTKDDAKLKQIASASGITALMGITEPALYGVNLPKKYPLIAAMIGGGCGGLYAGLTNTHRFATGSSGLPAVLLYIGGDTMQYFVNMLIALAISIVVTALVTLALAPRFEKHFAAVAATEAAGKAAAKATTAKPVSSATAGGGVATLVATTVTDLTSPAAGTIVALDQVKDAVFASGAMGPGVGIEPTDGLIVAPCSGTVVVAMDTGHAFGIRTEDGVEVLVHVGIDTVSMKGHGFVDPVKAGEQVTAGQPLVHADLDAIRAAGHGTTVILIVTNPTAVGEVVPAAPGAVATGEPVLTVNH